MQKLILRNLLHVGMYKYLGEVLFFCSSLIIARFLTPEEYGLIAIAAIFYGFFSKFTDSGLSDAIVREKMSQDFFANMHLLFIIKGAFAGLFMALLSYPIALFFDQPQLFWVGQVYSLALFFYSISKAAIAYLRKYEKLALIAKVELAAVVFHIFLSILLAVLDFSYWALVIPHIVVPFLYIGIYNVYVKLFIPGIHKRNFKTAWNRVKSMLYNIGILKFVEYSENTVDNFWIGKLYSNNDLGLYAKAYALISLPITIIVPQLNNVLLPIIHKRRHQENLNNEIFKLINLYSAFIFIPLALFILLPGNIATFLWGDNWYKVGDFLGILCIALIPQVFLQMGTSLFIVLHKERLLRVVRSTSAIILIGGISGTIFYSIDLMIYTYVGILLLINMPLYLYLGYYRALGFTGYQLFNLAFYPYSCAVLLLIFKWYNLDHLLMYPLIFLGIVSAYRVLRYIRFDRRG